MASEPRTQRKGRMSYADIGKARHQEEGTACVELTGGWRDDVGRVPPGQPLHRRPWRFGDLCSMTWGAQWDSVFWAVRAPSRADRTQRQASDVLTSQGKLECQAPRCKCGSKCPSKLASSQWLGQSSRARSSAALGCVWSKLRQVGTAPGGQQPVSLSLTWTSEVWQWGSSCCPCEGKETHELQK